MIRKICTSFFVLVTSFFLAIPQEKDLEYINTLTISDGLVHNGITSIFEDSRGLMWIGTYDGLNLYNGYEVNSFKNSNEKQYLASNRVRAINEGRNGYLWIGTDDGITLYDYEINQFKTIYSNRVNGVSDEGPIIRSILMGREREIVICSTEEEGIIIFEDGYNKHNRYFPLENDYENEIIFFEGVELDADNYLFASSEGLLLFNYQNKLFRSVLSEEVDYCNSIVRVKKNSFLITSNEGAVVFDYKLLEESPVFEYKFRDLETYEFNCCQIDTEGNLWLGTILDGIIKVENIEDFYNRGKYNISKFTEETGILRASYIFTSAKTGAWVGTFNEGIFRFDIEENPFNYYHPRMDYPNGIKTNEVVHINAFDENRFFVSANNGGVGLFNTSTDRFESLPFDLPKNYQHRVGAVFADSKRNIWIKFRGRKGINRIRSGEHKYERVVYRNKSIDPLSYFEEKDGVLWIGGGDDVYRIILNKSNDIEKIESLNDHDFFAEKKLTLVRKVYKDPMYNCIWLATHRDGLFKLKVQPSQLLEDAHIEQFNFDEEDSLSISSNFVTSITRLPNGELWIGTERGGICKVLDSDTNPKFINFSEKQGLSNNVVKNIMYDDEYNLWISTNIGLNKFDTKDYHFKQFHKEDGLPFEDFMYASEKLVNGIFVFGGLDGFVYFNPHELPDEEFLPNLIFGDLEIFNDVVLPNDTVRERVILKERISNLDTLELKHNENVFSIDVLSLHYSSHGNHYLKYKLDPINDDWIEVSSSFHTINYTGLQPGKYTFQVMASNSFNNYTNPKRLTVIIKPPFWATAEAYVLYFLILAIVLYGVISTVLKIQSLKHSYAIEQLEKENIKKLNDEKLRFFSNISHEIRTPLTLVLGPIGLLAERFSRNRDVSEKLQLVKRQLRRMSYLLDQVLDFQKSEANSLKMNRTTFCFDSFIHSLLQDFQFLADQEHKQLDIEGSGSRIFVYADKDKLEKVFYNLLNNAFKYTKRSNSIKIVYYLKDSNLIVDVIDEGRGINQQDLPRIFERFYQSGTKDENFMGGSGIGLAFTKRLVEMHYGYIGVESELGKGTSFSLRLPIVTDDVSDDMKEKETRVMEEDKQKEPFCDYVNDEDVTNVKIESEFVGSTIFFAEDNVELRTFVEKILTQYYTVKSFSDGKECLAATEQEWPDIVVSDVLMPELNGFELCRRMKSDIKTSHIPVVLLTACTSVDDQIKGAKEGADAYIKKPFSIEHLISTIESLLGTRKKLRERFNMDLPLKLKQDEGNANDYAFLEKLYGLMEENIDNQDLDLGDFARTLYLNRTYFFQKVKVLTGCTPFELLKNFRLKKAAELLLQNNMSVTEVISRTGFKSRTHFSKIFKMKYGVSPGKYASESKNKHS